jgi:hypothetical protein
MMGGVGGAYFGELMPSPKTPTYAATYLLHTRATSGPLRDVSIASMTGAQLRLDIVFNISTILFYNFSRRTPTMTAAAVVDALRLTPSRIPGFQELIDVKQRLHETIENQV